MIDFLKLDNYTIIGKREVMDCVLPCLVEPNVKFYADTSMMKKDKIYAVSKVSKSTFIIEDAFYESNRLKNFDLEFLYIEDSILEILVNENNDLKKHTKLIAFNIKELKMLTKPTRR